MTQFKNHKIVSAARTANENFNFLTHGLNAAHIIIDVTAGVTVVNTISFVVEAKDLSSGKYYTILASAVITAVGTVVLKVFKGSTAAANTVANDFIPEQFRVRSVHANATPITYSIGINLKQ